jgi:putative ABC transport system permease protein
VNELKHALRQLVLRPGLSAIVIVMLAIGIGSTTAIFSLFHEVLMQPLPVPEPDRLVSFHVDGLSTGGRPGLAVGDMQAAFSYPMLRDLEARQDAFTGLAAHYDFFADLGSGEGTTNGRGMLVSGRYFDVLNVSPALGRLLGPEDEPAVGEARVVVLSHDYWQRQFGADPNVVNRTLVVNGQQLTIVGVAPAGFEGAMLGWPPEVFVPLTLRWLMQPEEPRSDENRFNNWLFILARLRPGVSVEQATAQMNVVFGAIRNEIEAPLIPPNTDEALKRRFLESRLLLEPGGRGQSSVPGRASMPLTLLLGVTALVLLIVCVNVANLLLARGAARAGELAIQMSVGASRARLVAQLLAESALLAGLGALASLGVAAATLRLMSAAVRASLNDSLDVALSLPAMLFAAAAALGTVVLFGLAPALQATGTALVPLMKGHGVQAHGGRGAARFSRMLIMGQIAFATVLLVLAGLFTQSLVNIARVELGIEHESVALFAVSPLLAGYEKEALDAVYERVHAGLAAEPGVLSVASGALPMMGNFSMGGGVQVVGSEPLQDNGSQSHLMVSAKLFETLSVPLLVGRDFTEADRSGPPVTIVNEAFVRKFGLGSDAVGKRVRLFGGYVPRGEAEIVGVVANAHITQVKGDVPPQFFTPRPLGDQSFSSLFFYVRSGLDADRLLTVIPRVVASVDPGLPVRNLATMSQLVRNNVSLDRIVTLLSTTLAGLATLLAAIGLYGVLSYNVAQRTRELGLRLALGAEPFALRAMVLKQVRAMALIGAGVGLAMAVGVGRLAQALLYGLSAFDPLVLGAALLVLAAVVTAAAYVPARRASRVAPLEALRYE